MSDERCFSCRGALTSWLEKNRGECGYCRRKRLAAPDTRPTPRADLHNGAREWLQRYWAETRNGTQLQDTCLNVPMLMELLDAYASTKDAEIEILKKERNVRQALLDEMPCGHPRIMMLVSAETGEELYCDICDRRDQLTDRTIELREAERDNATLREIVGELAAIDPFAARCKTKEECDKAKCDRCDTLSRISALIRRAQEASKP